VAQALLRACAAAGLHGLAAPSANRFGRVSPTTAAHVRDEFGDTLLVLDGGPCAVGIESTIIDATRGAPVLLRPGQIGRAALGAAGGGRMRGRGAVAATRTSEDVEEVSTWVNMARLMFRSKGNARLIRCYRCWGFCWQSLSP
jgi:L-threonylcarbamoyladenylate synthase